MDKLTNQTKQIFFRLLDGDISIKDFEQWVYKYNDNLEKELEANFHFDLISFDYNQNDCLSQLKDKISPNIDTSEFNIWRSKRLLSDIIESKIDMVVASRKLRDLYFDTGENFIPVTLGIGYESVLDDVPTPLEYSKWDKKELKEKLKKVDWYKDNFIRDAKEFLDTLNKK